MIVILDPTLIATREPPLTPEELALIEEINYACRRRGWRLPRLPEYWEQLWSEFGLAFERTAAPHVHNIVRQLRDNGTDTHGIPPFEDRGVWRRGFRTMFGHLGVAWEERMACAVARAVGVDDSVIVVTRKISGRNVQQRIAGATTLDEITRWVLYVQPSPVGARAIRCVHHPRNLTSNWTSRYDWRLPSVEDGARYPFCPPRQWWKSSIEACRTIEGKPAWIDVKQNGWARPNIEGGRGYHWDVFIGPQTLKDRIGLSQINVVEYGSREGVAGSIHHVPAKKQPHINDIGWTCD